ncbi:hypothetical protein EVAR_101119_1 [Eumeta japonica]|uniref:Uncharacterized protein n=1 Tax=Eumeta variegata TaxID=151549 RepID=A0A4C1T6U0_EUMVA|nr:hypothetical protein EVAR_101119_1 [Eumeta japonica]
MSCDEITDGHNKVISSASTASWPSFYAGSGVLGEDIVSIKEGVREIADGRAAAAGPPAAPHSLYVRY